MNEIKYLPLLDGIVGESDIALMEMAAKEHRKYGNISFKIVGADDSKVIFGVSQGKSPVGIQHPQKRLIEIVHETFGRFFPDRKIQVHANPYVEPEVNQVDQAWIANRMSKLKVRLKDIADDTGLNYKHLSTITSGTEDISQAMKALFWYYFKAKEGEKRNVSLHADTSMDAERYMKGREK